jgi:hypothetical protein
MQVSNSFPQLVNATSVTLSLSDERNQPPNVTVTT